MSYIATPTYGPRNPVTCVPGWPTLTTCKLLVVTLYNPTSPVTVTVNGVTYVSGTNFALTARGTDSGGGAYPAQACWSGVLTVTGLSAWTRYPWTVTQTVSGTTYTDSGSLKSAPRKSDTFRVESAGCDNNTNFSNQNNNHPWTVAGYWQHMRAHAEADDLTAGYTFVDDLGYVDAQNIYDSYWADASQLEVTSGAPTLKEYDFALTYCAMLGMLGPATVTAADVDNTDGEATFRLKTFWGREVNRAWCRKNLNVFPQFGDHEFNTNDPAWDAPVTSVPNARYTTVGAAVAEVTTADFTSHNIGVSGGDYFLLYAPTIAYYVWYTVGGAGTNPAPAGKTAIVVDLAAGLSGETASTIATKTATAIDALANFVASATGAVVTITNANAGAVVDPSDVNTGVILAVTTQGAAPAPGTNGPGWNVWHAFYGLCQPDPISGRTDTVANHWCDEIGNLTIATFDAISRSSTTGTISYNPPTQIDSLLGTAQIVDVLTKIQALKNPFVLLPLQHSIRYLSDAASFSENSDGAQHPLYNHVPHEYRRLFTQTGQTPPSLMDSKYTNGVNGALILTHGDHHWGQVVRWKKAAYSGNQAENFWSLQFGTINGSTNFNGPAAGQTLADGEIVYAQTKGADGTHPLGNNQFHGAQLLVSPTECVARLADWDDSEKFSRTFPVGRGNLGFTAESPAAFQSVADGIGLE